MDSVRRWLEGWRLCRGLEPVIEYDDALAVVLRLPGRERELFALDDDPATVDRLASQLSGDTWLTVTTQHGDDIAGRLAAAGVKPFAEQKTLMSIALRDHSQLLAPASYQLEISSDGPLEYVRLLSADRTVAARGMMCGRWE